MATQKEALELSQRWIEAWNSRDLESVLSHYHPDVLFQSPRVAAAFKKTGGQVGERWSGCLHTSTMSASYGAKACPSTPALPVDATVVVVVMLSPGQADVTGLPVRHRACIQRCCCYPPPLLLQVGSPDGTLTGTAALRPYFKQGGKASCTVGHISSTPWLVARQYPIHQPAPWYYPARSATGTTHASLAPVNTVHHQE